MGAFFGKVLGFMYDLRLFILVLTTRGLVAGFGFSCVHPFPAANKHWILATNLKPTNVL